jgi:hypothetical protein
VTLIVGVIPDKTPPLWMTRADHWHDTIRLAAASVDSLIRSMPRQSRHVEPSYPAWKADAVKALQKLHERAAAVTRGYWPVLMSVAGFDLTQWPVLV